MAEQLRGTSNLVAWNSSGEVEWVEIELGLDDHNHLIRPEDRISVAMGIQ